MLAPLQRVQNAAARLVLDLKPRDHLTSAYYQLHWLPVRQRIEYKLCLLTHLAVTGKSPPYLASLLTTAKSRGSTSWSANRGDIFIPRTRLRQGERAFAVAAPRLWNRLPTEIRCISNTEEFKQHLKTFLFKSAFTDCWSFIVLRRWLALAVSHAHRNDWFYYYYYYKMIVLPVVFLSRTRLTDRREPPEDTFSSASSKLKSSSSVSSSVSEPHSFSVAICFGARKQPWIVFRMGDFCILLCKCMNNKLLIIEVYASHNHAGKNAHK